MTTYDFNIKYATAFKDDNNIKIELNPIDNNFTADMLVVKNNLPEIWTKYSVREGGQDWYFKWNDDEYLFVPTKEGFSLVSGDTIKYDFKRVY